MGMLVAPYRGVVAGGSFYFNGAGQYALLSSISLSTYPCTIMAWVKPDNETDNLTVANLHTGTTARIGLQLLGNSAGDPVTAISTRTTGTSAQATKTDFAASAWQHVAAVVTSDVLRQSYLGGVGGSTNASAIIVTALNRLIIGGGYTGGSLNSENMKGKIAKLTVHSSALNGTDIASAAVSGTDPTTIQPGSLAHYISFAGGVAVDSVTATALTVVGAVSDAEAPW